MEGEGNDDSLQQGLMAQSYNPSAWDISAVAVWALGQLELQSKTPPTINKYPQNAHLSPYILAFNWLFC